MGDRLITQLVGSRQAARHVALDHAPEVRILPPQPDLSPGRWIVACLSRFALSHQPHNEPY